MTGADRIEDARGLATIDVEETGRLGVVIQSFEQDAVLLVNKGPAGHWLEVVLRGKGGNTDAIGARLVAEAGGRKQLRDVTTTAGYLSGVSRVVHFGLGDGTAVEKLTVRWPDARVETFERVAADRRIVIVEGEGIADRSKAAPGDGKERIRPNGE